jgi:hypothetical protein
MSDGATITFVAPLTFRIGDTSQTIDVKMTLALEQVEALIEEHRRGQQ